MSAASRQGLVVRGRWLGHSRRQVRRCGYSLRASISTQHISESGWRPRRPSLVRSPAHPPAPARRCMQAVAPPPMPPPLLLHGLRDCGSVLGHSKLLNSLRRCSGLGHGWEPAAAAARRARWGQLRCMARGGKSKGGREKEEGGSGWCARGVGAGWVGGGWGGRVQGVGGWDTRWVGGGGGTA